MKAFKKNFALHIVKNSYYAIASIYTFVSFELFMICAFIFQSFLKAWTSVHPSK